VSGRQFSVVWLNIVKSALEMQASAFGGLTKGDSFPQVRSVLTRVFTIP
jgi:hypothetical protein